MKYRKEIDGLRALAVMPVILFHAGFSVFSGGFVGVDVFFVISGYLITAIIAAEMGQGRFSLPGFYERRARRILPALYFVMLCTLPFAWFWMSPVDLSAYCQSLMAVPLFVSNILFYMTGGYFGVALEYKPLLHTWSLAVEEQYYVLFPLFLMLTWRLGKKWIVSLLVAAALISLCAAQWAAPVHPLLAFYLLPTRCFEILIGALISLSFQDQSRAISLPRPAAEWLGIAGLCLILYAIFGFDEKTPYPGLYTLVPALGVGLILLFAREETLAGKLLGNPLLVGIGLISYSAYLWHQPLLAFARLQGMDDSHGHRVPAMLSAGALVLAYLSWRYIENPFRNKARVGRKTLFIASLVLTFAFIGMGVIGYENDGFVSRYSEEQKKIIDYQNYLPSAARRYTCMMEPENSFHDFKEECYGKRSKDAFMLWGDSYAAVSYPGLRSLHEDVIQLTSSACPPLVDVAIANRPNCQGINNFIKEKVEQLKPKKIFLQANWHIYLLKEDVIGGLTKTIEFIHKVSPDSVVFIIGSAPEWEPTLPVFLLRKNRTLSQETYLKMPDYEELAAIDKKLKSLEVSDKVRFLSLLDNLCIDDKCLAITQYKDGYSLTAWDDGHLTEAGSFLVYRKMSGSIQD